MALFTHASGQYLVKDDARIYYETAGNPNGFPLLLLHGGLGNLTDFNSIISPLIPHFQLIALDFRGHGKSTLGNRPLTYQVYQDDVEALLAYLNIIQYAVIGFSDGGVTAYRLASSKTSPQASKVKAMVAIAAHPIISPSDFIFPLLNDMTSQKWRTKFPEPVSYYERVNAEPDFDGLVQQVVTLWTGHKTSQYPGKAIKHIQAPTLLVRGELDPLFSHQLMEDIQHIIKGAQIHTIEGAGHEAHQDNPLKFIQKVKAYLLEKTQLMNQEAAC